MSLQSHRTSKFNRSELKEALKRLFQLHINEAYEDPWYCCEECSNPYFYDDYAGSGNVASMEEYHQMHLLTLLRSLTIDTAAEEADEHGW